MWKVLVCDRLLTPGIESLAVFENFISPFILFFHGNKNYRNVSALAHVCVREFNV